MVFLVLPSILKSLLGARGCTVVVRVEDKDKDKDKAPGEI